MIKQYAVIGVLSLISAGNGLFFVAAANAGPAFQSIVNVAGQPGLFFLW